MILSWNISFNKHIFHISCILFYNFLDFSSDENYFFFWNHRPDDLESLQHILGLGLPLVFSNLFYHVGRWREVTSIILIRICFEKELTEVGVLVVNGADIVWHQRLWFLSRCVLFVLGILIIVTVINLSLKVHEIHVLLLQVVLIALHLI